MIYGVVKQSGGFIDLDSEEGIGTTFRAFLPRVPGKTGRLDRDAAAAGLPTGDETVLPVEDETLVRELAIRVLERLGYRVLHADSGGDALVAAERRAQPIHLLLTDVILPGMNGRELAERLLRIHPEIKVPYTSGYTDDVVAHHGVIDEGLSFIGKPYTPHALARKLRDVLDRR
jgi:two-component system, cell cycle sensor histidine kinase and response regulator CckA